MASSAYCWVSEVRDWEVLGQPTEYARTVAGGPIAHPSLEEGEVPNARSFQAGEGRGFCQR